ncbi:hypothetical protein CALCODRAFT_97656 [Calocera cornea HHB12733]|uniref:Uncharacterized protein n=1 Tax=Calocera cornea HHB12733 TaxID=1353952 RepID=A0A165IJT9_9BASI|nr:hypothetical protein CALCODRAFT_97656 [Calocera cornea HHB12733]
MRVWSAGGGRVSMRGKGGRGRGMEAAAGSRRAQNRPRKRRQGRREKADAPSSSALPLTRGSSTSSLASSSHGPALPSAPRPSRRSISRAKSASGRESRSGEVRSSDAGGAAEGRRRGAAEEGALAGEGLGGGGVEAVVAGAGAGAGRRVGREGRVATSDIARTGGSGSAFGVRPVVGARWSAHRHGWGGTVSGLRGEEGRWEESVGQGNVMCSDMLHARGTPCRARHVPHRGTRRCLPSAWVAQPPYS